MRCRPDGMQRLLRRADWDVDGVRDDVRDYVVERLGDRDGVLIVDDTGFVKKGTRSAGVQRQYSGTAGRTENCQVGTFLAYASVRGHALIDRELYLPQSWTGDRDRCRAAGIPDEVEFTTKPRQAQAMLDRAIEAGVPFAWVTADEAYGQVKYLRVWLEERDVHHVVATRCNDTLITTSAGEQRADALIAGAAGAGVAAAVGGGGCARPAGLRLGPDPGPDLLAARPRALAAGPPLHQRPGEIAYYVCYGPRRASLVDLAWVAGSRWHVEECFQQAKGEAGLDHYQVRSWRAWYAHITLSMLALAWLAASKARAVKGESAPATRA